MRTIFVNEIWCGDKEVARGLIVANQTVDESLKIMFSEQVRSNIDFLINNEPTKTDGFHFFTRCCQFVVYFQYNTQKVQLFGKIQELGRMIELMYFGTSDNPNDVFDYMLKLRKAGWEESTRDEILEIAYQIKKDQHESHFEIAELKVKEIRDVLFGNA